MTQLASISNNHLALKCGMCGHTSLLPVALLIERLGHETNVHDAVKRLMCSSCGAKGKASFVITFVGGSGEAMLGAVFGIFAFLLLWSLLAGELSKKNETIEELSKRFDKRAIIFAVV